MKTKVKRNKIGLFLVLFFILIFAFSIFGMKYFTVADDNMQLGVYNSENDNIFENVILKNKSYNVRPFAFFADAYIFQWFWNNMYILLFIITLMHICNVFFVYKIAEKIGVKLNAFSLTLMAISPILIEGLYWVSASCRIVVSFFLTLASIYLMILSFEEENKTKKIIKLVASIVLNLICVGFYEQTIAINLFLFTFVLICFKKYRYIIVPFLSTLWIGIYYVYFMINGDMQARGELNVGGIFGNILTVSKRVFLLFVNDFQNVLASLNYALRVAFQNVFVVLILIGLIAYFIYYICKNRWTDGEEKFNYKKLILGLILFISPILPFFVLKSIYVANRNLYLPYFGLCIIYELIFDLILHFIKNNNVKDIIKASVIFILIFCNTFVVTDRVDNYKKMHELDNKVVTQLLETLDEEAFSEDSSIAVYYNYSDLMAYRNTTRLVACSLEEDWILSGAVQATRKNDKICKFYINSNSDIADYTVYFDENLNIQNLTN